MVAIQVEPYVFSEAVREFWQSRDDAALKQQQRGASDQGGRSAVTAGRHLDGFSRKIVESIAATGVDVEEVHTNTKVELPGFYRPSKEWDIVVVRAGQLRAAIELKSQVGPSFGNNFNNRTEEAMGSALDIWTAFREGAFLDSPTPFLGYLLLLEDSPKSRSPVEVKEPHFQVFEEFLDASYIKRYELFCRKLVLERQYTAACFLTSDRQLADRPENYSEPALDLSAERFLTQLLRHVA